MYDSDLATLASDFNRTDCSETTPCEGDINGDGAVNADDLTLFAAEFGRTNCPHDELYYFYNDHLGTPQRITDQTGTIVWSANYKPFGEAIITTNTIPNPFRFPGQYYDQETGLHYNYFRYYDPGVGRYLRVDPIGQVGGTSVWIYAEDNPIGYLDFWALKTWIFVSCGGGGGIGPIAGEGGIYYLIDPSTGKYHQWAYGSLGVGIGFGGAAQVEVRVLEGPDDPTQISNWSLTVSAFAAAGKGISGQYTGTSFWGKGEAGETVGFAGGAGAGMAGMLTYSYYPGKGNILPPKYRDLYLKYRDILGNKDDICK